MLPSFSTPKDLNIFNKQSSQISVFAKNPANHAVAVVIISIIGWKTGVNCSPIVILSSWKAPPNPSKLPLNPLLFMSAAFAAAPL